MEKEGAGWLKLGGQWRSAARQRLGQVSAASQPTVSTRPTIAVVANHTLARITTGIFVCLITTFLATDLKPAKVIAEIEHTLKMQLIISTLLMTPVALGVALWSLPPEFTLSVPSSSPDKPFDEKVGRSLITYRIVGGGLGRRETDKQ